MNAPETVVVFSTTDIQFTFRPDDAAPLQPVPNGILDEGTCFYSSGALEAAVADGHTVVVVTTRRRICPTDKWWVDIVGEENVYLAARLNEYDKEADPHREQEDAPRLWCMLQPWHRLFERLDHQVSPEVTGWMQVVYERKRPDCIKMSKELGYVGSHSGVVNRIEAARQQAV